MPTHRFNENMLSDELFRRRTPGKITAIDIDGGFFRWEISDFEDKGKCWDVTFERVAAYQFTRESAELSPSVVKEIEACIQRVAKLIHIKPDPHVAAKTN